MYNFIGGEIVVQDDACGSVFEVERMLKYVVNGSITVELVILLMWTIISL